MKSQTFGAYQLTLAEAHKSEYEETFEPNGTKKIKIKGMRSEDIAKILTSNNFNKLSEEYETVQKEANIEPVESVQNIRDRFNNLKTSQATTDEPTPKPKSKWANVKTDYLKRKF